ncbi:hypothetical protein TRIATDRAFT_297786 [Trichoderma atroviride IMI 206040]|uniref:Uncharacterized protein n=1 Tax=Hypocrea atroviridis (strain ATCC 20476 / IMI 206040) TaxID=452589 RepID=G9NJK1_HYPAI|nr:uncharacterized protein TRIATDRAFT_297786 [Trichoderma atroviride IMI 206040]EHK49074.1 hypothetical protein TRIATDRAFT_297786 [Trichoderma atroviride IMI 206040]
MTLVSLSFYKCYTEKESSPPNIRYCSSYCVAHVKMPTSDHATPSITPNSSVQSHVTAPKKTYMRQACRLGNNHLRLTSHRRNHSSDDSFMFFYAY